MLPIGRIINCYNNAILQLTSIPNAALILRILLPTFSRYQGMTVGLSLIHYFFFLFAVPETPSTSVIGSDNQSVNVTDTLYWRDDVQLRWDDFQSREKIKTNYAAFTYTIITLNYSLSHSGGAYQPKFSVKCAFQRSRSWVDRDDAAAMTAEILAHEQLHFHIAEITARKLRKALTSKRYTKNYAREINELYERELNAGEEMQQSYDRESQHGINDVAQKRWSEKVPKLLQSLAAYRGN